MFFAILAWCGISEVLTHPLEKSMGTGHVLVVYGVGVGPEGKPNQNYLSVMDPATGGYENILLSGLPDNLELGYRSGEQKFASCRSRPKP